MGPDRFVPPKIMFMDPAAESGMVAKFAYLVRFNGVPWAFADLRETHKDPHDAKAFQLDPSRIVEETNTETGQTYFAYRGAPSFP
jgi:hypothetical protein